MTKKLYIKTFGCQMNEYDSDKMVDVLAKAHDEGIEKTENPEDADVIIFNTCSVREKAQEKVFSDLGRLRELKRDKPGLVIGVGGCVASQEGAAIVERAPYVDVVFGPQTLHRLPDLIAKKRSSGRSQVDISFPEIEKFDHLPPARVEGGSAFVSIMEGCSKYCSYCVVPYTRGEEVSRPLDDVLTEVAGLAAQGVKEITLLGQNVNAYRGAMGETAEIADFALLLNIILLLGAMASLNATLTMPGIAGIILAIGMAVDSNVLIYERMREELARGVTLRMSIQNGFDKALAAIVDSNVTTLITAVILYLIGTDLIRGFAVSLFIGLVVSLFTCLYMGHLLFNIVERKRWVTTLKMMQFLGETKLDFLSKRMTAYIFSATLIGVGMLSLFVRGSQNMDIDFSGGTMVTFEFVQPQSTDDVRKHLEEVFPNGVSLERLLLSGEEASSAGGLRYRIRTTEQDQSIVADSINKAFSDQKYALRRVSLDDFKVGAVTTKLSSQMIRFEGGHQADLTFSGSLSEATVTDYLAKQLSDLKGEGDRPKYDAVQLLLSSKGTKAAVEEKKAGRGSPKFTEFSVLFSKDVDVADVNGALTTIKSTLAKQPLFEEVNAFDTSVANETKSAALIAIIASLIMIVIYIWFRFEKVYFGYAAVAALAHDVLVTLGCIALGAYLSKTPIGSLLFLEDFKINMGQIACLLTIVGYSLNDTIVIFDRIREIKGKSPKITYDMINQSVNQTLSRTILTALTVFIVVIVLYVFGGEGIHGFAFSMIIGVLTGAYSTIYIANPVLFWLVDRESRARKPA